MYRLAVRSHLRPRFAHILEHYGHARSRRRVSARHGESPCTFYHFLHCIYVVCYMGQVEDEEEAPISRWTDILQRQSGRSSFLGLATLKMKVSFRMKAIIAAADNEGKLPNGYPYYRVSILRCLYADCRPFTAQARFLCVRTRVLRTLVKRLPKFFLACSYQSQSAFLLYFRIFVVLQYTSTYCDFAVFTRSAQRIFCLAFPKCFLLSSTGLYYQCR